MVGDAVEGCGDFDLEGGAEDGLEEAFDEAEDVVWADEGGFDIYLSEFSDTVAAGVFVTEAASDLEVFFDPRDHEELFVLLRGLAEGVEFSGEQAAWD